MTHEDLPIRWKTKIADRLSTLGADSRTVFSAGDFPCTHDVTLEFDDDSRVRFRYALLMEAPELNEIGVFTEHCGYHVFPMSGVRVACLDLA